MKYINNRLILYGGYGKNFINNHELFVFDLLKSQWKNIDMT